MHGVTSVMALGLVITYVFYYSKTCLKSDYYLASDENLLEYKNEV